MDSFNIPELKENEVYVSHVGDGEYDFYVFGSVHRDLDAFIDKLMERYPAYNDKDLFVSYEHLDHYEISYIWGSGPVPVLAWITIEEIDPKYFPIGEKP